MAGTFEFFMYALMVKASAGLVAFIGDIHVLANFGGDDTAVAMTPL